MDEEWEDKPLNIEVKTTYDYDTLRQFQQLSAPNRIFSAFITGAMALLYGILYFESHNKTLFMVCMIFLFFFIVSLWDCFRQGNANIKNAMNLDSEIHYTFQEEGIQIYARGNNLEEKLLLEYSRVRQVRESKRYIYLYVARQGNANVAYIVDKEGFIQGSENELKKFLYDKIDGKKIKLKFR